MTGLVVVVVVVVVVGTADITVVVDVAVATAGLLAWDMDMERGEDMGMVDVDMVVDVVAAVVGEVAEDVAAAFLDLNFPKREKKSQKNPQTSPKPPKTRK